jgi:predicted metal-dependent hydrolase
MYERRSSRRTKHLRVSVYPGGRVVVSHPVRIRASSIERFLIDHAAWIEAQVEKQKNVSVPKERLRGTSSAYRAQKEAARALVHARLAYFNQHYGFFYARVAIKNMSTRWGSCSQKRNLNFHYKIINLPSHLQDYLVVHELCHLQAFNHGAAFWSLVAETIPAYKVCRAELRTRCH